MAPLDPNPGQQDDLSSRINSVAGQGQQQAQGQDDLNARIAAATGTTKVNMVGPKGEKAQVSMKDVPAMRQQSYALTPDNPGVVKAVDYKSGQVNYILPQEVEGFHNAGNAIVEPDGGIRYPIIRTKEGVIWQDPLEEQQAHERVFQALNADEKSRTNKYELKEFGKAGLGATAAVATVPLGGAAADVAPELGSALLTRIGTAGGAGFLTEEMAQQAGAQVLKKMVKTAVKKYVVGEVASRVLTHKSLLDNILDLF